MSKDKKLFDQLSLLTTEKRNSKSSRIDSLTTSEILRIINQEDARVPYIVKKEIRNIAKAVNLIVNAIKSGGRLIYIGAGTSGRLGVLDAAEIPPTFGTEPETVQAVIAGGKKAVFKSQEGSEDKTQDAIIQLEKLKINRKDVVCGIAASLRTPFVTTALKYAKQKKSKTVIVTTNPRSIFKNKYFVDLKNSIDISICLEVGPEVIMGSTRMKSGTAQKLVLNMLTTATMIRLGKVYGNMMIDLKMNSRKLEERAKRVLMMVTGINYDEAEKALKAADGHVKTAIVMVLKNIGKAEAKQRLKISNGFVRKALQTKLSSKTKVR